MIDIYMGRGTSDGGTMEFCAGRDSLERAHGFEPAPCPECAWTPIRLMVMYDQAADVYN